MPLVPTAPRPNVLRYRGLFPDWGGARPVSWYFGQELLEARHASQFPTNLAGPDEDVNVYLVHLLAHLVAGPADPRVLPGADPLLMPPDARLPRSARADHYAANGDHRLVMLGLFDVGDGLRRRRVPWGVDASQVRARDLAHGQACYALAANLLEGRPAHAARAAVLRKLADRFDDYVHVLGVLATRRWNLGAQLDDGALAQLLQPADGHAPACPVPVATMDDLLDDLAAWQADPTPLREAALRARAAALGVDPARLGLAAA